MSKPVSPLFVHLPLEIDSLLEQMTAATKQSKARLVIEGLKMLSQNDLNRIRALPRTRKPRKESNGWLSAMQQPVSFFSRREK